MSKAFLKANEIKIGSWWAAADGGKYGKVVLAVDVEKTDAKVLGTDGKTSVIDTFKLQYRYKECVPNQTPEVPADIDNDIDV